VLIPLDADEGCHFSYKKENVTISKKDHNTNNYQMQLKKTRTLMPWTLRRIFRMVETPFQLKKGTCSV